MSEDIAIKDVVALVAAGGAPWLTLLKPLRYHFSVPIDMAPINNGVATVFSSAVVAYYTFKGPADVLLCSRWWILLVLAALIAVGHVWLFVAKKYEVEQVGARWPVVVAFTLYIAFFCSLAAAFGNIGIFNEYSMVEGSVRNALTQQPLASAKVEFELDNLELIKVTSDKRGNFRAMIAKDSARRPRRIVVNCLGYRESEEEVGKMLRTNYDFVLEPSSGSREEP